MRALYSDASLIGRARMLSLCLYQQLEDCIGYRAYRQVETSHGLGQVHAIAHEDEFGIRLQTSHCFESIFIDHSDVDDHEMEIDMRV